MKKTFVAITIAVLTLFSCQEEDSNILQGDDLMKKIKEEMNDVPADVQEETAKEEVILLDVIPEKALPKQYQMVYDQVKKYVFNDSLSGGYEQSYKYAKKQNFDSDHFWSVDEGGVHISLVTFLSEDSLFKAVLSYEFNVETDALNRVWVYCHKTPEEIREPLTHNLNAFLTKLTNVKGTQFSLGEPDWQEKGLVYDNSTTENIDQSVLVKWEGDRSHKIEFYRCFNKKFVKDEFLIKE